MALGELDDVYAVLAQINEQLIELSGNAGRIADALQLLADCSTDAGKLKVLISSGDRG